MALLEEDLLIVELPMEVTMTDCEELERNEVFALWPLQFCSSIEVCVCLRTPWSTITSAVATASVLKY